MLQGLGRGFGFRAEGLQIEVCFKAHGAAALGLRCGDLSGVRLGAIGKPP